MGVGALRMACKAFFWAGLRGILGFWAVVAAEVVAVVAVAAEAAADVVTFLARRFLPIPTGRNSLATRGKGTR